MSLVPLKPRVLITICLIWSYISAALVPLECFAAETNTSEAVTDKTFSDQYTAVTKRILLAGVDLERFSLNYRRENAVQSRLKQLVYFGTQEAGAACTLGFEAVGVEQFNNGRHRLLSFKKKPVSNALKALETGSIIAASGSAFALSANAVRYAKACKHGFDSRTADKYVHNKLSEIDQLLAQREALVEANSQNPAYQRAVIEGRILKSLRGAFLDEYGHFSADTRGAFAAQNMFFLMNIAYNTVAAVGAEVANRSLTKPKLNGPANILFIVSGALAGAAPMLTTAQLHLHRMLIMRANRQQGGSADALREIAEQRALLEQATNNNGSLMPSFPSTQRLALYTESNKLFEQQLQNEITIMSKLNKVALQNAIAGPAIGGLLMTQGILGTRGYYKYFPSRPKKQFDLDYRGAVVGTVGASMAVVGNAALMLASLSYEHKLKKKGQLPVQLIQERLAHLDELEKTINAI